MDTKQAQRAAVIDTPKTIGSVTLYPATFGLLEWLQSNRKNPLICGGVAELKHAGELCFAFTRPSLEVVKIPPAKLTEQVRDFMHGLSPDEFHRIQKHAETELLKFQRTAVVPKKHPAAAKPKRRK